MVNMKLIKSRKMIVGQGLAEFAITFPFLILIFIGIFDLGRVVYSASALQNAAREGARFGAVNPWNYDDVIDRVKSRSLAVYPDDISVNVDWDCPTVRVDVDLYIKPITLLIGSFFPDGDANITLSSELQRERWLLGDGGADAHCPIPS